MDDAPTRPRILLADDEILVRDLVEQALLEAGYDVTCAGSAADGLVALEAGDPYAGVVTDINFKAQPDGWALGTHARELRPDIAVVYMSGDSAHLWSAHGVPDSAMLTKPCALSHIVVALAAQLNRSDGSGRA